MKLDIKTHPLNTVFADNHAHRALRSYCSHYWRELRQGVLVDHLYGEALCLVYLETYASSLWCVGDGSLEIGDKYSDGYVHVILRIGLW